MRQSPISATFSNVKRSLIGASQDVDMESRSRTEEGSAIPLCANKKSTGFQVSASPDVVYAPKRSGCAMPAAAL